MVHLFYMSAGQGAAPNSDPSQYGEDSTYHSPLKVLARAHTHTHTHRECCVGKTQLFHIICYRWASR